MGATAIQVVALFFCLFFSSATAAARANELCSSSMCGDNGLTVRFPFRIKAMQRQQQQQHCGYPGFDLSCSSNLGKTILKLPFSEGFWVKKIDYVRQEIRIGDPGNCLPRRLLHLNLSGSPFKGEFYQTYQFFNCSSDFPGFQFDYIPCLSSSTHMVFATSYIPFAGYVPATCDLISTVSIPVVWQEDYESNFGRFPLFELSNELQLTWDSPNCGDCEARDGKCGFMTNSTLETGCFGVPRRGITRNVRYAITIGVGIPALMCAIGVGCYICSKLRSYSGRRNMDRELTTSVVTPQALTSTTVVNVKGLDGATIESYPKLVLGESRRLPTPDDNTCAICLSEYRPKETLRSIPECKHCFHADCVDEWLRINAACPLCRNTPGPLPPPDDAA